MRRGFLDDLFYVKKLDEFYYTHQTKCGNYSQYNIKTRTTGIGVSVSIKCKSCGAVCDVSNYKAW